MFMIISVACQTVEWIIYLVVGGYNFLKLEQATFTTSIGTIQWVIIVHDVGLLVKDDRVESEDGTQVQEMHSSAVSAQHVIEVAEETNVVTDLTAGSSASPNKGGDTNLEGQSAPSGEKFSVKLDVSEHMQVSSSDQFLDESTP